MVNPISYDYNFSVYPNYAVNNPAYTVGAVNRVAGAQPVNGERAVKELGKAKPSECMTCKNRKYVDRSNDMGVSFKTPTRVSPQSSYAAVSAHENQHVGGAVGQGSQPDARLISVSVRLKMAVCPECGTQDGAVSQNNEYIRAATHLT